MTVYENAQHKKHEELYKTVYRQWIQAMTPPLTLNLDYT